MSTSFENDILSFSREERVESIRIERVMKLLPSIQLPQLPPVSAGGGMTGMDSRLPPGISLPFSPTELLWRYGPAMNFPPTHPPPSPFLDFKTHLPASLGKFHLIFVSSDEKELRFGEAKIIGFFFEKKYSIDRFQKN